MRMLKVKCLLIKKKEVDGLLKAWRFVSVNGMIKIELHSTELELQSLPMLEQTSCILKYHITWENMNYLHEFLYLFNSNISKLKHFITNKLTPSVPIHCFFVHSYIRFRISNAPQTHRYFMRMTTLYQLLCSLIKWIWTMWEYHASQRKTPVLPLPIYINRMFLFVIDKYLHVWCTKTLVIWYSCFIVWKLITTQNWWFRSSDVCVRFFFFEISLIHHSITIKIVCI